MAKPAAIREEFLLNRRRTESRLYLKKGNVIAVNVCQEITTLHI